MSSQRSFGLVVTGVFAACFGVVMAMLLYQGGPQAGARETWLLRGCTAMLAALSGVAAEALWNARPWAMRASLALAGAYAATVTAICVARGGLDGVEGALGILFTSSVVVAPVLAYVHGRTSAGPRQGRTPVSAPRRPPLQP